jgi:hypothetical protein
MTPEILQGLLWAVRSGLRLEALNLRAGHGVADPNYRPPQLPYSAVIGPLNLAVESERDLPRSIFIWVRTAGYLSGGERPADHPVPDPGQLHLRFDTDATVHLSLDFEDLTGEPFNAGDTGTAVAAVIQTALVERIDAEEVEIEGGELDPTRSSELREATIRWDRARHRLVIASGRRGVVGVESDALDQVSRVEVLAGPNDLAEALGFNRDAIMVDGRIVRHRIPTPTAVAVDVRLDLWAGSQRELALIMDQWSRITPTRGHLLTRTGLLSADAAHGDVLLSLQRLGESATPWTLLQLEPELGFVDRLAGTRPRQSAPGLVDAQRVHLAGNATVAWTVYQAPPVPQPWRSGHPAPDGYSLTWGLQLEGGAVGQEARILHLAHGNQTALQIDLTIAEEEEELFGHIRASAQHDDGTPFPAAEGRVRLTTLQAGADLHVLVSARSGRPALFVNGMPIEPLPDAPDPEPDPVPGTPSGGDDMLLIIGDPTAADFDFNIIHLQLHGRPFGPTDPLLRRSLSHAAQWRIGDPIALVSTKTGYSAAGEAFHAAVIAVEGEQVRLDRPLTGNWSRAGTLVYQHSLFYSQKQLRRRDDFMNQLFRITAEYRISAFLEERLPATTAPLVEEPEVEIRGLPRLLAEEANPDAPDYKIRPAPGRPRVLPTLINR